MRVCRVTAFFVWLAPFAEACLSSFQQDMASMLKEAAEKTGWHAKETDFSQQRYHDATHTATSKQILYTHVTKKNTRLFTDYLLSGTSKKDRAMLASSLDLDDSTVLHGPQGVFVVHGGATNVAYLTKYLLNAHNDNRVACAGCHKAKAENLPHTCLKCGAQICQSCHEGAVQTSVTKWKKDGVPATKIMKHVVGPVCPICKEPRFYGAIDVIRRLETSRKEHQHDEL